MAAENRRRCFAICFSNQKGGEFFEEPRISLAQLGPRPRLTSYGTSIPVPSERILRTPTTPPHPTASTCQHHQRAACPGERVRQAGAPNPCAHAGSLDEHCTAWESHHTRAERTCAIFFPGHPAQPPSRFIASSIQTETTLRERAFPPHTHTHTHARARAHTHHAH